MKHYKKFRTVFLVTFVIGLLIVLSKWTYEGEVPSWDFISKNTTFGIWLMIISGAGFFANEQLKH